MFVILTIFSLRILSLQINFKQMCDLIFYHAKCPVCVSAEKDIINLIGADKVEVIHIGNDSFRIHEAEKAGVKSVPALVAPNGNVLHINFGALVADVKG